MGVWRWSGLLASPQSLRNIILIYNSQSSLTMPEGLPSGLNPSGWVHQKSFWWKEKNYYHMYQVPSQPLCMCSRPIWEAWPLVLLL